MALVSLAPARQSSAPRETATPLRIAFLSYRSDPRVGGQGVFVSRVAQALADRGHAVDIVSGPPYPEVPRGVGLAPIPSLDLYAQPHHGHRALRWRHLLSWSDTVEYFGHLAGAFMEPYTFGRRASAWLRHHGANYDVVLDNQSLSSGLLSIERAGLPVVGVIHHPVRRDLEFALEAEPRWGMRRLLRQWYSFLRMQERVAPRLRRVIVVSEASRRDVSRYLKVDPARAAAIPLGVDREIFRPTPFETRRPARLVTTASADTPLKGLRYLLQAFAPLAVERPLLELVVVGRLREGPTTELLDSLRLRERVQFRHDLPAEAMGELFGEATICVTPSLYEGFGLPAAEAMSTGAPVVVTDGGALPEVVGEAGVVVPAGDAEALRFAIAGLLDDPSRRRRLGAAAAARAEARFSWARVAEQYEEILLDAAGRRC
ncbi:MAG TPA: glycosyltransferase family 4 protein [Caulobacteraceae bacterium]|jgi:glycosyltransferase involved in cell wall biosynthesis